MNRELVILAVLGSIGLALIILGSLIKFKKAIYLVAGGYKNEEKIIDKEKFTALIGGNVFLLGFVFCLTAGLMFICPAWEIFFNPVILIITLGVSVKTYLKSGCFMRK
ncbi:MAG: DUF3784 domain-containing protein [Candidatus Omnitrophica bacterium]|nr:DUF3784 domain-containing protein [Candidatus Omnitrophota bacterium]